MKNCLIINNYWMRLSGISRIIEAEVSVICRSRRLRKITLTEALDNSRYPAKTEFNNYFIIHMDYYQNNDLITTKKSNKVSQDKMFSKQKYFGKPVFTSFTVCWREQK